MRPVNLQSVYQAYRHLSFEQFQLYMHVFGARADRQLEMEDLCVFIELLYENIKSLPQVERLMDGFYLGYSIPQISKEFDLLRFGHNFLLNIELKHMGTEEKIARQLATNSYYLKAVSSEVYLFTFVAETKKIYSLDKNDNLVETDLQELIARLQQQSLTRELDLDTLFAPKQYLVSPLNSTEKFINENYFLTNAQRQIKQEVMTALLAGRVKTVLIKGTFGTGKTLLTYDIAHEHMKHGQEVIIVHNGTLSEGHLTLRDEYGWRGYAIKDFYDNYSSLVKDRVDLIVFDEAQRTYTHQLTEILDFLRAQPVKCIFSFDPEQFFSASENRGRLIDLLQAKEIPYKEYQLSKKIRTNKELSAFILNLFDRRKINRNPDLRYNNVHIQYFTDADNVRVCLKKLEQEGWQVLVNTPSGYDAVFFEPYEAEFKLNAQKVIGQEFDKVAVVINEYFYYNEEGKLAARPPQAAPDYMLDRILYQNVTRAREALHIVICRNPMLLEACSKIINKQYGPRVFVRRSKQKPVRIRVTKKGESTKAAPQN